MNAFKKIGFNFNQLAITEFYVLDSKESFFRFGLSSFLMPVKSLYPEFDTWMNFTFRRNMSSGERKVVVAVSHEQILGVSLLKSSVVEKKICTLFVHPDFRHNGLHVGSRLMKSSLELLDSNDVKITVCSERLVELSPLLHNSGFKLENVQTGAYRPDSDESIFSL